MESDAELRLNAERLLAILAEAEIMLASAESCTGGLLTAVLTDISGCSHVLDRGFVTYTNEAKQEMLGVSAEIIERHGAVSRQCAEAMAAGALSRSRAGVSVSITGIAGPDGGSEEKPVGLVHFAAARQDRILHRERRYGDIGRGQVRRKAVLEALDLLAEIVGATLAVAEPAQA